MDFWWRHNSETLPQGLSGDVKSKIEFFTGRMPHILRGLLKFPGKQYSEIKNEFTTSDMYSRFRSAVKNRMSIQLHEYMEDDDETKLQMYVHTFFSTATCECIV